jgi:polysaccharide deacetylase family protein (PEP-CTERM system associated)
MMNCLSFDVEGFAESNKESLMARSDYSDRGRIYEIETNVDYILSLLSRFNVTATFFILGTVARDLPHLVRSISNYGHEIASHSQEHIRIYNLSIKAFKESISYSKYHLEDIASCPVYGFRAPDFSIIQSSIWALDVLRDVGYLYDSSIYPFGFHDVYGIKHANPFVQKLANGMIEFPLPTIECFGMRLPFGGGGYFRLYPIEFTNKCIDRINALGESCMIYLHPYEVGPELPNMPKMTLYRRFRHYYNCNQGESRLIYLISKHDFSSALTVLSSLYCFEDKQ